MTEMVSQEENFPLEAEDDYSDSAIGSDQSDTTSIASSIYAGYIENGRRYQTVREGEYWGPSDEKQFETMETLHLVQHIMDSHEPNPLFHSAIKENPQNILDIGTGTGIWAKEVADRYPSAQVIGVDLYPPPDIWVPSNCKLEVDDVLKRWQYKQLFDLVHIRILIGAFTDEQWRLLYKQAYKNILPGGYIEQLEPSMHYFCDDGTMPKDAVLAGWGQMIIDAGGQSGKHFDTSDTMKAAIEAAGFVNVQEKVYKIPIGEWTKNPRLKEAGKFNKAHILAGIEGYAMFILTKFGLPQPWSPQEVQVLLAKARNEYNNNKYHMYLKFRRVWGQKPFEPKAEKAEVAAQNVA